jgi:hypothetical protein
MRPQFGRREGFVRETGAIQVVRGVHHFLAEGCGGIVD